ncbi:MAG: hypothetical protein HY317_06275 [Acidobacteria bacterium]|nr:hypothetical protein [Acidobacteriota bacterium]
MLYVLASFLLPALAVVLGVSHRYWQRLRERERFILTMREITTPQKVSAVERARLELLRAPWWAAWRWLPDLWDWPTE